jgi:DNA-binding XRE family transcriptional regulator
LTYSEDEADDFRETPAPSVIKLSAYRAEQLMKQDALFNAIDTAKTINGLEKMNALLPTLIVCNRQESYAKI